MFPITEILTRLASGLMVTAIAAMARWLIQRRRTTQQPVRSAPLEQPRMLRHYTFLRTTDRDGRPARYETALPTGTVITHRAGDGSPQRFKLTDVPMGDGTYAAEPLDR